ncbi:DUF7344 domain-containing protein [Haloarchaeobius iranensis]|uniref:DUF7344 domain-containing protein n=1 Tax=Haloarchaeobius iranensis TaxID=996166 RepID=A0A1G9TSC1_9EURY|nr:hypothetical protein [Haloarchaeobius iranensis]SDM50562.1 hypothetical protein SAMN05192554_103101 [Haloarchaeobius iranensis]
MDTVAEGDGGSSGTLESPETSTSGQELSTDVVYQTLSNQRRRSVLRALQTSEQLTVRELTAYVAARECGVPVPALEYKQRKRVYTSLVQTHLPALAKNGIVGYDKSRGTVARTDMTAAFAPYLTEQLVETAVPGSAWGKRYLALAASFVVVVALGWLAVPPLASLPGFAYGGLFAGALAATAAAHLRTERLAGQTGGTADAGPIRSRDWAFWRRTE